MPRALSVGAEHEYEELLAYLSFFATNVMRVEPSSPMHPGNSIKGIVAQFGKSKALIGLRQATNDTVEQMQAWNAEAIGVLDQALHAANALTASEVRRRYGSSFSKVVKRGSINTETEYHLVTGIVNDLTSQVSAQERLSLEHMLAAYEAGA
jgi:hypothetical protein